MLRCDVFLRFFNPTKPHRAQHSAVFASSSSIRAAVVDMWEFLQPLSYRRNV